MGQEVWRNKYYVARDSTNRSQVYINRLDEAKQRAGGNLFDYLKGAPSGNVPADKDGDTDSTDAPLDLKV